MNFSLRQAASDKASVGSVGKSASASASASALALSARGMLDAVDLFPDVVMGVTSMSLTCTHTMQDAHA